MRQHTGHAPTGVAMRLQERSARPRLRLVSVAAFAALLAACGGGNDSGTGTVTSPGTGDDVAAALARSNELKGNFKNIDVEMHEGTNMAAVPSPDGTMVVMSIQGALWTMPAAGGKATKITPIEIEATQPAWSPDGKLIAFQNYAATAGGNYHIWVVQPDGHGLREVTSGFFDDREPSWFPDSSKIVFSSDRSNDKQYKIWSVTLAGEYKRLTLGTGAESNPVVSPDGRTVAYVDSSAIFTVPSDGSGGPTSKGAGAMPQWTPDGKGFVYQNGGNLIVNGNAVTSGEDLFPFPVTFMKNGGFMYTASGKVLTRDAAGANAAQVPFSATYSMRRPVFAASQDRPRLGNDRSQRVAKGISSPAISPDGKSVAFIALNDLWVMKLGENPVRLTNDTDREATPLWTKDGTAIYFSADKGNAGSLAVDKIVLATKARTRWAKIPSVSIINPQLSPTEDRIAYTTGSGLLEIMDLASQARTALVDQVASGPQVSRPQWSADGKKLMVVDSERINSRFREGYNKLRVVDIATKTPTFYPVGPAPEAVSDREEGQAVWSPDGTKVAFIGDSVLKVLPTNADGSPAGTAVAITKDAADMVSWTADSQTLMYMSNGKLKTISPTGSGEQEVPVRVTWTQAVPDGVTIIRAGALWNGVSEALQHDVDITITGNRITAIGPHDPTAQQRANKYVDASSLTVMPGMWDPHFHPVNVYQGSQFNLVWASMFAHGFTSVQSVGGSVYTSTEMREALEAGNLIGPRLFTSSPLLEGSRSSYSFARNVRTPEIADIEIAKYKSLDLDFIKSYVREPYPVMARLASGAHDMGVPSATHLAYPGFSSGLSGLSHLQATQRMGYGFAKSPSGVSYQDIMSAIGTGDFHLMETLSANRLAANSPILLGGDRFDVLMPIPYVTSLKALTPSTAAQLAAIKVATDQDAKAIAAGALFAIGTDVPLNPPGVTNHSNLMALGLSMSNHLALQAITINAAKMLLKDQDLGSVEVGKLADLTIVQGNPLDDLKYAAATQYVVKNGFVYSLADIVAPFKSTVQVAARKRALFAFDTACRNNHKLCFTEYSHAGH